MPPRKSRRKAPAATQQVETPPATQQDEATPATQQDEAPLASQLVEAPLKDYLCSYPAEVLIEILVHVDTKTFFDLVHTCAGLRDFLRNNAARICNRKIMENFPDEVKELELVLVNGWLVASSALYMAREANVNLYWRKWYRVTAGDASNNWKARLRGSCPGPQLLFLLESKQRMWEDPTAWCAPRSQKMPPLLDPQAFGFRQLIYRLDRNLEWAGADDDVSEVRHRRQRLLDHYPMYPRKTLMWYYGMLGHRDNVEWRPSVKAQMERARGWLARKSSGRRSYLEPPDEVEGNE